MMIVGVILFLLGAAGALLFFLGLAPAALAGTPVTFGACVVVAIVGLVIMMMNRRPAN